VLAGRSYCEVVLSINCLACLLGILAAAPMVSQDPNLGVDLLEALSLAVGLFASSLTENQIVAAVLAFVFLIVFWIINWVSHSEAWYGKLFQYISIYQRFDDFTKGILNVTDVFYYLSFAFFGLFVTGMVLQSHRWQQ